MGTLEEEEEEEEDYEKGKGKRNIVLFFYCVGVETWKKEREREERMNSHVTCLIMNWNVVASRECLGFVCVDGRRKEGNIG